MLLLSLQLLFSYFFCTSTRGTLRKPAVSLLRIDVTPSAGLISIRQRVPSGRHSAFMGAAGTEAFLRTATSRTKQEIMFIFLEYISLS